MENYRRSSHSVYDIKYHIVWITKYRKPVLRGEIADRVRELIREICKAKNIEIIKGHISRDHVHLFVSVPPHLSVSKLVQSVKGEKFPKADDGTQEPEPSVLGTAYLGQRVLCGKLR